MIKELDLLFLHVPRQNCYYPPLGEFSFANLVPMGLFALAELAGRKGYKTAIVHPQVEEIKNPEFDLIGWMKPRSPKLVAFSLTWHMQVFEVLNTVALIKENFPQASILLGGYTASFFHREILENFPQVDFIIRGEGEKPLVKLLAALAAGGGAARLAKIPNLVYREGGEIRLNPLKYHAQTADLDDLEFADFSYLKNHQLYFSDLGLPPLWLKGRSREINQAYIKRLRNVFFTEVGRGCSVNCTWCGGGKNAHLLLSGRKRPVFRSPEKVLETMEKVAVQGIGTVYFSFDPYPGKPDFYLELFRLMRKKHLSPNGYFECWGLPDKDFCQEFYATFGKDSALSLSPESGSEEVRKLNKGMFYPNDSLFKTLDYLEKINGGVDITFALGIPGEGQREMALTQKMMHDLRKYRVVEEIMAMPIEMEPASPWYLNPEKYGVVSLRKSLQDFYQAHAQKENTPFTAFGYYQLKLFGGQGEESFKQGMDQLICRQFCPLSWLTSMPGELRKNCFNPLPKEI